MKEHIKVGIIGYGNLGKGVVVALENCPDFKLIGIFTRRNPVVLSKENSLLPFYSVEEVEKFIDKIDVMILCGGSATDLPIQGPKYAKLFHVVDSFDTHSDIPDYFEKMDRISKQVNKLSLISVGWDPGLFSINRLYAQSILPNGITYTFWGKGVSQGHSDAIRRVEGVKNGIQYTIPIQDSLQLVRSGSNPTLTTRQKHFRQCFVVPEVGADLETIHQKIVNMPSYFDEYDTEVNFITEEEFFRNHQSLSHGGYVIHSAKTGDDIQTIEYSLTLESNPHFTGAVLVAFARALYRFVKEGKTGAITVFDIPPSYLSIKTDAELRSKLL